MEFWKSFLKFCVVEVAKLTGDTIAVIQEHYSTPNEGEMQEAGCEEKN